MKINNPEAIYLVLSIFPFLFSAIIRYRSGSRQLLMLGGKWRKTKILDLYLVKFFFSTAMFILFIVTVTFSLMGIVWGQKPVHEEKRGIDVAFVIDISRSMLAEDLFPSRLDQAVDVIRTTIKDLKGSRFSITVFKGSAVVAVPLTEDIVSIESFINNLTPSMLSSKGTNIELGLTKAVNSFPLGIGHNGAVILITDADELEGNIMRGADLAATNNIPVFTIGAGSVDGAPIVLSDGTIIKDQSGNTVISSLDESTLQRVAERTGGAYFNLSNPAVAVNLLDSVREINEFSDRKGIRFRNIEHFRFFIILSLIFVFLNYSIRGVKWKKDF
ncbi:MAG: VWA domain-containing protein [Spirochaetaceae bacterium]|jgi:Ca-activated chloride channel family protein|nr:VWA domain-containing protein [Spirochaetaceae bacterium]